MIDQHESLTLNEAKAEIRGLLLEEVERHQTTLHTENEFHRLQVAELEAVLEQLNERDSDEEVRTKYTRPNPAFPNGRCFLCGSGLSEDTICTNEDCSMYK